MDKRFRLLMCMVTGLLCGCAMSVDTGLDTAKDDSFSSSLSVLAPGEMVHENLRLIWRATLDLEATRKTYMSEDALYVEDFTGRFISIDRSSGAIRWQRHMQYPLDFSPCFQGNDIYALAGGRLVVLDKDSGLEQRRRIVRVGVVADPGSIDEWLLVGSTRNSVHGVDLQTGNDVWRARLTSEVLSILVLPPEYVIATTTDGEVAAFQIGTGGFAWRLQLGKAPVAPPLLVGEKMYIGNSDFYLYMLDARRGVLRWKAPCGGVTIQRPALIDGIIYLVINPGILVAMDEESKEVIWEMPGVSQFLTAKADRIYARGKSGDLIIGDAPSGKVLQEMGVSDYRISLAEPDGGIIYLVRADGQMVALADESIPYIEKPIVGR